ncbi:GTP-binding protein SAR1b [Lemmus lemmus]
MLILANKIDRPEAVIEAGHDCVSDCSGQTAGKGSGLLDQPNVQPLEVFTDSVLKRQSYRDGTGHQIAVAPPTHIQAFKTHSLTSIT